MNDMKLILEYQEIIKLFPNFKENIDIYENPFIFSIDDEIVVVGELEMYNGGKGVYIKNINSLHMRKGHGRIFIIYLLKECNIREIIGESVQEAVPFWYRMGAIFPPDLFEEYIKNKLDEKDLIPFTIKG